MCSSASKRVLYSLKSVKLRVRKVEEERVAVVKFRMDDGSSNDARSAEIERYVEGHGCESSKSVIADDDDDFPPSNSSRRLRTCVSFLEEVGLQPSTKLCSAYGR